MPPTNALAASSCLKTAADGGFTIGGHELVLLLLAPLDDEEATGGTAGGVGILTVICR